MGIAELQVPPKAVLEIFESKSVSTGMKCAAPGGVNLTVGGKNSDASGAVQLIPLALTLRTGVAIDLFSSWLHRKLNCAGVRHIRINGVEIEVTTETIRMALSEFADVELASAAHDDDVPEESSNLQSLPATMISEEEIIAGKDAVICLRVPPDVGLEQYVPGSAIQKCSVCQSDVLVAPSTQRILAHGENEIVCMECWTAANPPEPTDEEHQNKLRQLEVCKQAGEQAYDDMYEKAHHSSDAAAFFSNAKESFHTAIGLARELGLEQEVEKLEQRLAHIKAAFRSQFS